jgi:hypothetical protein
MPNEANSGGPDNIATVKDRVLTGPAPSWVIKTSFDHQFKSDHEAPVTYLLWDTQIHAERRETFTHFAVRLETMEAVQHQSQWRLQFEPKTQLIVLHSLKIRRGDVEIDQLNLQKAHFLQREEGLERFVIHGWFTFLMILEDVRPGDILDYSYTIENHPRLLPEHSGYFFSLPQGLSVGKYHFSLHFNIFRPMKWKSSGADLKPVERCEQEIMFWEWSGDKYVGLKPEANMPLWHIAYPWIQISDFPDWQMIAAAIATTWVDGNDDDIIAGIIKDIQDKESSLSAQIEKLIQLIQDECRYLSLNLELGGYVPTSPSVVARRRFGDCKDLSFLLVNLLKKFEVPARPVLVNTFLKKTIGDLLPMPSLFNHVVVEFEADGKKRWIDTTMKGQGGGPFNRFIPDYELGLPVDTGATGLVKSPQISGQSNLFELRENFLLATSGEPSLLAITLKAEGNQADMLRQQLQSKGVEELTKQRLQAMVNRFGNAKREGLFQYRDERMANQFVLTEVFEVSPFLAPHPNDKLCRIQMPSLWVAGVLAKPEKTARRTPFALPHPCQIVYIFDVDSPAIYRTRLNDPHSHLDSQFVEFRRDDKSGHDYFLMTISLTTNAGYVPADQVEEHRVLVEKIWQASSRELSTRKGFSRAQQKKGFGELPAPLIHLPPLIPKIIVGNVQNTAPTQKSSLPEHRQDEVRQQDKIVWWVFGVVIGIVILLILIALL